MSDSNGPTAGSAATPAGPSTGPSAPKPGSTRFTMSLLTFTLITTAAVISIRNFPTMALVGWQMITFNALAIAMFLIPAAFVAAELATGWPEEGGVYAWVKHAFGEHWGFSAIWIQWFQMTIGFIGVLAFIGGTFGYLFDPALANNKLWVFLIILVVWWGATLLNMRGMETFTRSTTTFVAVGTIVPMGVLIFGGLWWVLSGHPTLIPATPSWGSLVPNLSSINNFVLLVTFIFFFIGIEMTAAHANDLKRPGRDYPIAIFLVGFVGAAAGILGGLVVAWLVPAQNLSLIAGIQQTYQVIFGANLGWLVTVLGVLVVIGAVGQVLAWVLGPVRGLGVAARAGDLPPSLQGVNRAGIPVSLMIFQALIVSGWGLVFLALPGDVNSSFWALFALATTVYVTMYLIMFASAIKLRYSEPNTPRRFRVPGGKLGMWLMAGWGFGAMCFVLFLSLLPPTQIAENPVPYEVFMVVGTAVVVAVPQIIYRYRKPHWKPQSPGATSVPVTSSDSTNVPPAPKPRKESI